MGRFIIGGPFPRIALGGPGDLARRLGLRLGIVERLACNAGTYYRPFHRPKLDGGVRTIDQPIGELKRVQEILNERILAPACCSPIAFGGVRGRAHTDVYAMHARQPVLMVVDIQDFFPSVTNKHVFHLMRAMGMNPRTASLVTKLVTFERCLPQGSPASTTFANLLLHDVDARIHFLASERGVVVTRVVDDIHISGPRDGVRAVCDELIRAIHRLGLRVHRGKLKTFRNDAPQVVMNANVNTRPSLPRSRNPGSRGGLKLDELRAAVGAAERRGISARQFRSLKGKLSYALRFNARPAETLIDRLSRVVVSG